MPEPYGWTFTDGHGIRRQVKIHKTRDGRDVIWDPRHLGDPAPWYDADYDMDDPDAHYEDDDLATLGMPVAAWSGYGP